MEIPPRFKNAPLSAIVPIMKEVKPGYPPLWIWADLWEHNTRAYNAEEAAQLARDGWKREESISVLQSQLYHTIRYAHETEERIKEGWYQGEEPLPVVLAFSIASDPPPATIYMLNPLPLPQHGEYAFVTEQGLDEVASYYILDLPLEARQRWVALGEAITRLSDPLQWPAFTQRHKIASNDNEYMVQQFSLDTRRKLAIGATRDELIIEGASLGAARIHIENLRAALLKPDWRKQWQEVQNMARELARDYYNHHIAVKAQLNVEEVEQEAPLEVALSAHITGSSQVQASLTVEEVEQEAVPEKPAKKVRRQRSITPIVAKGQTTIQHNSIAAQWEILIGLRNKNLYTLYPDYKFAEHQHSFMQDKGHLIITISAQEEEKWETVISALNTLGDGCIDTYIAINAIALEQNGTDSTRIRTPLLVNPDDILAICGKEKSHGSYTPFQRAEVIKHLKTLSQTKIIMTMPGQPGKVKKKRGPKRKGAIATDETIIRVEGALIDLGSFRIGEYKTITGEEIWEKRSISVGPWISMIPGINVKYAIMFRQLLAYSAKNERYQKRIGLYLTQMFRVNAVRHKGQFPHGISMNALLEGSGIVPEKNHPGRFRDAVINAIEQLKRDGIIANYWQIVDASDAGQQIDKEVREQARGWFEYYLKQKWNFAPPQSILDQYKNILKEPDKQD